MRGRGERYGILVDHAGVTRTNQEDFGHQCSTDSLDELSPECCPAENMQIKSSSDYSCTSSINSSSLCRLVLKGGAEAPSKDLSAPEESMTIVFQASMCSSSTESPKTS